MNDSNNYRSAVQIQDDLFAVQLEDGSWSIADGPGSILCEPGEQELAGWHLPVRFDTEEKATAAIRTAPHVWFDISPESAIVAHCISCGGRPVNSSKGETHGCQ